MNGADVGGTPLQTDRASVRPRVLVFAYTCDPTRGSEPGAGWALVEAVREFADCTVLVAPRSRRAIAGWIDIHGSRPGAEYVGVGEARVSKYLRWHRIPFFLQYLLWMRRARRVAMGLHRQRAFDAAYHATVSVYWLPTSAARLGIPLVWGPVGGGVVCPPGLWPTLGLRGLLDELLDMVAVRLASLLPATRHTWDSVSVGLINNEETLRRLPRKVQAKCQILNHVLFLEPPEAGDVEPRSNVLFFSALESRKGPRLALRALALAPATVALVFAGDGPELGALRKMAVRLGISDRVVFRTGLKRAEALAEVAGTAAVVFTGLREEGGASLAEAMNLGAPVIVLANGGARTVAESCVDSRRVVLIAPTDVAETAQRFAEAMASLTADRLESRDCNLSQEFAMTRLRQAFKTALEVKCR